MRRGFTFIEVIFVVVLLGILAAMAVPRLLPKDDLGLATDQVINHIRYTQHLAMVDDRYDHTNPYHQRYRWRLRFIKTSNPDFGGGWTYTIFADRSGDGNNYPSLSETALDPHTGRYLSGGFSSTLSTDDRRATEEMALTHFYQITDVDFDGCNQTIVFDAIGRSYSQSDDSDPVLANEQCTITLTHQNGKEATICIEPESGYTHRCD
jgi:prepilin-type N-terminal cleavage/methylation domain-containing protein